MNLKEQLYVCTLAQTGSLSKAAQLLFISQPALSLYISNLEKQLGIQLFDRIGKQFTLTYAGELYVEQAKKMLAMKETFDSKISELINGRCERLRVGIQSIRSANMAPYLLPRLESSCERLKIFWKEDFYQNLEKMLLEDQLDVFLCSCSTPKKEFVYYPFFQDEVVFFTGANHPMGKYAQKRPGFNFPWIDLSLFKEDRFLMAHEWQSIYKNSKLVLDTVGFWPCNIFTVQRLNTMAGLAAGGFGVSFTQSTYLAEFPHLSELNIYSILEKPLYTTFCAVYKKGKTLPLSAEILIHLMEQYVQQNLCPWSYPVPKNSPFR